MYVYKISFSSFAYRLLIVLIIFVAAASCKVNRTIPLVQRGCDSLYFDLDTGMINAVSPMLSSSEIQEWFPCFTRVIADGAPEACGGGVFYAKKGFYYNTYFDYVEADTTFQGKLSHDVLRKSRIQVRKILGPDSIYSHPTYPEADFFEKKYGCLVVIYKNNTAFKVSAHNSDCSSVVVCGE